MNIRPPNSLGAVRYRQYTDIAGELERQRKPVWWALAITLFMGGISALLVVTAITGHGSVYEWLLAAFVTLGTVLCGLSYLPMLWRVQVGIVCDRGVGHLLLRRDGSVAREHWYAFNPETRITEKTGRSGRTWAMRDQYLLTFSDGRKTRFVASYLVSYEDETHLEFIQHARRAFLSWQHRTEHGHRPHTDTR